MHFIVRVVLWYCTKITRIIVFRFSIPVLFRFSLPDLISGFHFRRLFHEERITTDDRQIYITKTSSTHIKSSFIAPTSYLERDTNRYIRCFSSFCFKTVFVHFPPFSAYESTYNLHILANGYIYSTINTLFLYNSLEHVYLIRFMQ